MTEPCGSKEEIHRISEMSAVTQQRVTQIEQQRAVDTSELKSFMADMRGVTRALEQFVVRGEEQLRQGHEKFNALFQKGRDQDEKIKQLYKHVADVEDEVYEDVKQAKNQIVVIHDEIHEKSIKPLEIRVSVLENDKRLREGRNIFLRDIRVTIPVICTMLTAAIAIYAFLTGKK